LVSFYDVRLLLTLSTFRARRFNVVFLNIDGPDNSPVHHFFPLLALFLRPPGRYFPYGFGDSFIEASFFSCHVHDTLLTPPSCKTPHRASRASGRPASKQLNPNALDIRFPSASVPEREPSLFFNTLSPRLTLVLAPTTTGCGTVFPPPSTL